MSIFVTLRRVRLNQGGYDSNGHYWGHGEPLYYFSYIDPFNNLEHSDHIRSDLRGSVFDSKPHRENVKNKIRAMWPDRNFTFRS